jgi:hypothetical protein
MPRKILKAQLNLYLPVDLIKQLHDEAERQVTNASALCRKILADHFAQLPQGEADEAYQDDYE